MTPAERIEELEAEVAYLKSELGLSVNATQIMAIRAGLNLVQQEAQILLALYGTYPKALTRYQVWDRLEHPGEGVDENATNSVDVRVSRIRRKAGRDLIEVVRRVGLRLTPKGATVVHACLNYPHILPQDIHHRRALPQLTTCERGYTPSYG